VVLVWTKPDDTSLVSDELEQFIAQSSVVDGLLCSRSIRQRSPRYSHLAFLLCRNAVFGAVSPKGGADVASRHNEKLTN